MKNLLVSVVLIIIVAAAGYFTLPMLIARETASLKGENIDLKKRVEKLERFVAEEEEARSSLEIKPGADAAAVARGINAIAVRMNRLEASFRKESDSTGSELLKQKSATEAALKRQGEVLEKEGAELRARLGELSYSALVAELRERLLKVKTDLLGKNIGIADAEVERVIGLLEKAKGSASAEAAKSLEGVRQSLVKARGEMAIDLPAAMKRIDLLWHELGKDKITNARPIS